MDIKRKNLMTNKNQPRRSVVVVKREEVKARALQHLADLQATRQRMERENDRQAKATIQNWIFETRMKKQRERAEALAFWEVN